MGKARLRIAQLIERAEILVLASHDFSALKSLCQRGVVFHRGEIVFDGLVDEAVNEYKKINKIL
jgi:lipopolysaccharide transport system ATP-binding protein